MRKRRLRSIKVRNIMLLVEGHDAVVRVELDDGEWVEVIRNRVFLGVCHCVTVDGITAARARKDEGKHDGEAF